jgi:hypothetical protein
MNSHGNISFSWEEYIFVLIVEGAFNEEGIEVSLPLLQESVLNSTYNKWKRLEMWDSEVLASPETIKRIKFIWSWFRANGCTKTAVVISNSIQAQVIEKYSDSSTQVFLDKEKALEWLRNT